MKFLKIYIIIILISLFFVGNIYAADLTSGSFIIKDPVVGFGGGYQSSASFEMFSANDLIGTGNGSSVSFMDKSGFLYYPLISKGTFSGTPSASTIVLNWTPTLALQGLSVSYYNVGISTISHSPYYSYTNFGNATTGVITNLLPGTYYLVLQTLDIYNNVIATSDEISVIVEPSISFAISSNVAQFGSISASVSKYANTSGGSTSEVEAHQLLANTNFSSGYTITVQGAPPSFSGNTISPIGSTSTAPVVGTNQFGIRVVSSGGSGGPTASYGSTGFAYDASATTSSIVASESIGDAVDTNYSVRYLLNIEPTMSAGNYSSDIIYVITPNF